MQQLMQEKQLIYEFTVLAPGGIVIVCFYTEISLIN